MNELTLYDMDKIKECLVDYKIELCSRLKQSINRHDDYMISYYTEELKYFNNLLSRFNEFDDVRDKL